MSLCTTKKGEGERGIRGRDGWMASLMQWTWTWTNSRRWWGTGRPGMLQSMGSQRVRHDWATEQPRDKKLNLETSVLSSFLSVNHWHKCFLDPKVLLNTCLSSLNSKLQKMAMKALERYESIRTRARERSNSYFDSSKQKCATRLSRVVETHQVPAWG